MAHIFIVRCIAGQNRGKAAVEFVHSTPAAKAASHMDGGQIDGAVVDVQLSDLPLPPSRSATRSRSPVRKRVRRSFSPRNIRRGARSFSRSRSRSRSYSPLRRGYGPRGGDSYRGRSRGGIPPRRGGYRRLSRSRSPLARRADRKSVV